MYCIILYCTILYYITVPFCAGFPASNICLLIIVVVVVVVVVMTVIIIDIISSIHIIINTIMIIGHGGHKVQPPTHSESPSGTLGRARLLYPEGSWSMAPPCAAEGILVAAARIGKYII